MVDNKLVAAVILFEELLDDGNISDDSTVLAVALTIGYRERKSRIEKYVEDVIPRYNFQQFKTFFRLSPDTYQLIMQQVAVRLNRRNRTAGRPQVNTDKMVLITLWFMATLDSVRSIADRFNVSESTVIMCTRKIISLLCDLSHDVIKWPSDEVQIVTDAFQQRNGFRGVLGAIDGTHVRIESPTERADDYYNRKGYHSVVLQAVCREDRTFTNIYCGWPGRVHDARIFRNSPLHDNRSHLCGRHHLLGDGAYPLKSWLITAYRDNGHLTAAEKNCNKKLSQLRVIIEQAFGMLKGRFRRLQYIMVRDVENIVKVVIAACVLHNICIMNEADLEDCFNEPQVVNDIQQRVNEVNGAALQKRAILTQELQ